MCLTERQRGLINRKTGIARGKKTDVITRFIQLRDAICTCHRFTDPRAAALRGIRHLKAGIRAAQAQ
ncbi:hypothetical protein D3C71_2055910 [compost metagenome]